MFNEGKTPMVVFGVRLDTIYKNRKLYGKYCRNLFPEDSKNKFFSLNNINVENIKYNNFINSPKLSKSTSTQNKTTKPKNKIFNKDVFIDFDRNNFINNTNNTVKDYLYFKIKLRKKIPFQIQKKIKSNINLNLTKKNKSQSFNNINLIKNKNNISKINSGKNEYINNLHLNISPFKKKIKLYDEKKYKKKWNSPKAITFEKVKVIKKTKINKIDIVKNYCPNYSCIFSDISKSFVRYDKNNEKDFKNIKSGITRKAICNYKKLDNSSNNYNIINAIIEEKRKKKEERIKKKKKAFGQFYNNRENGEKINK